MTDAHIRSGQEKLGVGRIVGGTFSIFFSRFLYVIILGIVPAFLLVLLQRAIDPDPNGLALASGEISYEQQGFGLLFNIIGQALVTALIIRMAYDAILGHTMRIGSYFSSALNSFLWIVLYSIIVAVCAFFGAFLAALPGSIIAALSGNPVAFILVLPAFFVGFYIYAMWFVVTPAIVIEDAGFGGLGRSFQLTRNYRWSCAGTVLLLFICAFIPIVIMGAILGFLGSGLSISVVLVVIESLASGLAMAFFGIGSALLYARLREIKEGTSVEQLADVFV